MGCSLRETPGLGSSHAYDTSLIYSLLVTDTRRLSTDTHKDELASLYWLINFNGMSIVFLSCTNNLYTVVWFEVFLSNMSNYVFLKLMSRVFANGSGDQGSIPGRIIPKTQKMVLDASLLNTQRYKVRIKGKVEQSREKSSALPYTWV